MFTFYRLITILLYPFLILLIYVRKILNKEDKIRYKEKIFSSKFNCKRNFQKKLLWFHAASIGELKSIIPILTEIKNKYQNLEFLITTVTVSSGNLAKEKLKNFDNIQHRYFPVDVNFILKDFLKKWKPNAIFLVDSEIWPNLIFLIKKNKIPLALINARITLKSFKRWKLFSRTARGIFGAFNMCLTSNIETKNYLKEFSAKNIFFTGNIKLINDINEDEIKNKNERSLKNNKVWFAASTHMEEEEFCINVHKFLKKKYPKIITIIAPRHINRSDKIKKKCEIDKLNSQIVGEDDEILNGKEVVIINSFGELNKYFKYIKSVFIGKSTIKRLENVGGQSPIDAAKLGCKIYHGPYVYNFQEIYEILKINNISHEINSFQNLAENISSDFENKNNITNNSSVLMEDLRKKTLKDNMSHINKFLSNEVL